MPYIYNESKPPFLNLQKDLVIGKITKFIKTYRVIKQSLVVRVSSQIITQTPNGCFFYRAFSLVAKTLDFMKEKEIWIDIIDYEGLYQVSNLGNIKSINYNHTKKEKILKTSKYNNGYLKVNLYKNGKTKTMKVHRLVAAAFVQNDSLFNNEVNHIDENPSNNCAWNLEWCDRKYNCNFGTRNERVAKSLSKLLTGVYNTKKSKPVICIETGVVYPSSMEIQRKLGFNQSHISKCCNGKRNTCGGYHWKYVD